MNLFDLIPPSAPDELFTELLSRPGLRIERIVSFGQYSPDGFWYEQAEHEWVLLLEGSARIRFDHRTETLGPGDWLDIPAGTRHRVEQTASDTRTVWLAIFYSA